MATEVAVEAGPTLDGHLPSALRESKARYDRSRRAHQGRAVNRYRDRYPQLWARVGDEVARDGGGSFSARQHASAFLRRAAAHAAERGDPIEEVPRPPEELQRGHAAYQRAFRQLWANRRAADPALWARCSGRRHSSPRAWPKFRERWRRQAVRDGR